MGVADTEGGAVDAIGTADVKGMAGDAAITPFKGVGIGGVGKFEGAVHAVSMCDVLAVSGTNGRWQVGDAMRDER